MKCVEFTDFNLFFSLSPALPTRAFTRFTREYLFIRLKLIIGVSKGWLRQILGLGFALVLGFLLGLELDNPKTNPNPKTNDKTPLTLNVKNSGFLRSSGQ